MGHALVPVSAGNEEHGRTVRDGTDDGTAGNNCTGLVHSAAGTDITTHSTTVTRTASRGGAWLFGRVGRAAVTWKLAGGKRACSVDQGSKVVDCRVLVVPESIRGVAKLSCELRLQVRGDGEQSQRGDETLVLHSVQWLESEVLDLSG